MPLEPISPSDNEINKADTSIPNSDDAKYKMMTEKLRMLYTDDEVRNYIIWIITSDTAREYWEQVIANDSPTH